MTKLEPVTVAMTSSLSRHRCAVCRRRIADLEVHVTVRDGDVLQRICGTCAAAADDPEMRRFGRDAVAFEKEHGR